MAGVRSITESLVVNGVAAVGEWAFAYDDTWDSYDWSLRPWDIGYRDISDLDLSGDVTVTVTGGEVQLRYFRIQGNASKPWREGLLNDGNTPVVFPAGSGPNPKTVGELDGVEIVSVA